METKRLKSNNIDTVVDYYCETPFLTLEPGTKIHYGYTLAPNNGYPVKQQYKLISDNTISICEDFTNIKNYIFSNKISIDANEYDLIIGAYTLSKESILTNSTIYSKKLIPGTTYTIESKIGNIHDFTGNTSDGFIETFTDAGSTIIITVNADCYLTAWSLHTPAVCSSLPFIPKFNFPQLITLESIIIKDKLIGSSNLSEKIIIRDLAEQHT